MLSDAEWQARNEPVIAEFRANSGRLPGRDLVLLTTTGAKSGREHTTPLMYLREGDTVYVIASKQGSPSHPAWFFNLRANPSVVVELGGERYEGRAHVLEGAERERVYAAQVARYPFFAEYEAKTARQIPVVAITRA